MNRKLTTTLVTAILALSALALPASADTGGRFYTFDKELSPWKASELPGSSTTKGTLKLIQEDDPRLDKLGPGNIYAGLTREYGEAVYMVAAFEQGHFEAAATQVTVAFQAKGVNCPGCIALVYIGRKMPTSLAQFTTDWKSLDDTWSDHKIRVTLKGNIGMDPVPVDGKVIVGITFTNLDGMCPINQVMGVDNIGLRIQKASTQLPPPVDH